MSLVWDEVASLRPEQSMGPNVTAVVREHAQRLRGKGQIRAPTEDAGQQGEAVERGADLLADGANGSEQRQAVEWEAVAQALDQTSTRKRKRMVVEEDDMPELDDEGLVVEGVDIEKMERDQRQKQREKVMKRFCDILLEDEDDADNAIVKRSGGNSSTERGSGKRGQGDGEERRGLGLTNTQEAASGSPAHAPYDQDARDSREGAIEGGEGDAHLRGTYKEGGPSLADID